MALETSYQNSSDNLDFLRDDCIETSISVEEFLKRLAWATASVPAPDTRSEDISKYLAGLSPEELLKIRATALQLEVYHNQIIDFLNNILDTVNSNGYISPVRIK